MRTRFFVAIFALQMAMPGRAEVSAESLASALDRMSVQDRERATVHLQKHKETLLKAGQELNQGILRRFKQSDISLGLLQVSEKLAREGGVVDSRAVVSELMKHGLLIVKSMPEQCEIAVDDKPEGQTVLTKWYPTGKYRIKVSKDGFLPASCDETVKAAETITCSVTLSPK